MSGLWGYALMMVTASFIATCSQMLLKHAAKKTHKNFIAEYLNRWVIGAYSLFGLATLLSMYVLRHIPLSLAPILESTAYIFVAVLGWVILKERLNKRQILGMVLIVAGIFVFSL
ncbi:MAG: DMT family transporter [Defluviitaleaceae bacterium]|nr:DMT family transporter [Defluviitaleaceae bacterium]